MSRCLRCNKPVSLNTLFCEDCRAQQNELRQRYTSDISLQSTAPLITVPPPTREQESFADIGNITIPLTASHEGRSPDTPPPGTNSAYVGVVEQAMQKLSDAARRIAAVETGERRVPHPSRLSPLRDISADIQRHSTPMPKVVERGKGEGGFQERLPDLWPWLPESDTEDGEADQWAQGADPLLSRRIPTSMDAAEIEQEDLQRAIAEGSIASPFLHRRKNINRLRLAFVSLAVLAVLVLTIDSILVSVVFLHPKRLVPGPNVPPMLTLSPNVVSYGQKVVLHIRHFNPGTNVYLTHDIDQALQTSNGSPLVQVDRLGNADISTLINYTGWETGFHTIEAEDVKTRYSADATLQIAAGRSTPPSLVLKTNQLDFGSGYVGTNTIRPFILSNGGNGAITWAASSNQPWLVLTPNRGTFSGEQTIAIAVERANLKVGNYTGEISFSTNVGMPETVEVNMSVTPLPANAGPVLSISPAVLAFNAQDGGSDPDAQVLVISNPGSAPLSWSLGSNTPANTQDQGTVTPTPVTDSNWLTLNQTRGVVMPGAKSIVTVSVHSHNLLPGAYLNTLIFNAGQGAVDSSQTVSVSLTIQPNCGLTLSSGNMTFTSIAGQSNPSTQVLNIGAAAGCSSGSTWHATSSANWVTLTPNSGTLQSGMSTSTTVSVNTTGLGAGSYSAILSIVTPQSTQAVMITLTLQKPPAPNAPVLGVSTLSLNFNTTQGQPDPPAQTVTITNTGGGTLHWRTQVNMLATNWLGGSPTGGNIAPGQTGQLTVSVFPGGLTPGAYVGQITIIGEDVNGNTAGGSPQLVTVNLQVLPPCSLVQPSSSALAFSAAQGGTDPAAQTISLSATGNCSWPINWKASITSAAPWLNVSPASGSFNAAGQAATITLAPTAANLAAGTYTTQVSIDALDSSNMQPQGSPQILSVTLTITGACSLSVSTPTLSFTVAQGQTSRSQALSWQETGNCIRPVTWTVAPDAQSSWLVPSATSGSDTGSGGAITVSVNASNLTPGTYTGYLTVTASSSNGSIQGSPQTVQVSVRVPGFTIGGSVDACPTAGCASPAPLPGATVTLLDNTGKAIQTKTADANGNFGFSRLALGSYTISVSGTDSGGVHYTGTLPITVTKTQVGLSIIALPG